VLICRAYFKKKLVLHNEELTLEGTMASAERESITVVWGWSPQRGEGHSHWPGSKEGEAP